MEIHCSYQSRYIGQSRGFWLGEKHWWALLCITSHTNDSGTSTVYQSMVKKYHILCLFIFVPHHHSSKKQLKFKTDDENLEWFWVSCKCFFFLSSSSFSVQNLCGLLVLLFMNLSWRTRFIQKSPKLPNSFVQRLWATQVKTQMPKGLRGQNAPGRDFTFWMEIWALVSGDFWLNYSDCQHPAFSTV